MLPAAALGIWHVTSCLGLRGHVFSEGPALQFALKLWPKSNKQNKKQDKASKVILAVALAFMTWPLVLEPPGVFMLGQLCLCSSGQKTPLGH